MDRQEVPLRTVCPNCSTLWRLTSDNTVEVFRECSRCRRSMLPRKAGDSPYVHEIIELAKTAGADLGAVDRDRDGRACRHHSACPISAIGIARLS